jgi:hypothetical protein
VVPTWLDGGTQGWIAASSSATVLQHGYAHVNHALNGGKSIELGGRGANAILDELRQGFEILCDAFGAAFLGVLAPPWNRIDPGLYHHLSAAGFHGLSIYGPRPAPFAASGVAQINTHLDPIDWRGTRLFVGEEAALERLIEVMAPEEPIGLLSHHLDMDEPGWAFFDRLLELLRRHPAARLCPAPARFAAEQDTECAGPRRRRCSRSGISRSTSWLPRAWCRRSAASASTCRRTEPSPWSAKAARARP